MLKLVEPFRNYEIFIISLFLIVQDLGFENKILFCCSFWLIFCPLDPHIFADPDPDPGSQNLADPWIRILSTVVGLKVSWAPFKPLSE